MEVRSRSTQGDDPRQLEQRQQRPPWWTPVTERLKSHPGKTDQQCLPHLCKVLDMFPHSTFVSKSERDGFEE